MLSTLNSKSSYDFKIRLKRKDKGVHAYIMLETFFFI